MHRAAVLKGVVAGGAALLLGRSSSFGAAPVLAPDESVADAMKIVTGQYRRLEVTTPVADLLTPVRSHLRLINRTLAHWPNGADRKTLAAAASEAAGLAGWLAMDLDDRDAARSHYRAAIAFATQAQSAPLRAYMLGSMSAWAAGCGLGVEALRLAQAARPFVTVGQQPTARAWLAATEAVAYAATGDQHAALASLDHAEAVVSADPSIPQWPWMYAFDQAKVERYRATCYTRLKLPSLAGPALQHALDTLPPTATKQRALLLADLAEVALMYGEIDRSVALLTDTFTIGIAAGSRRIVERVRDVRLELAPWETATAVQALDRHLLATFLRRPSAPRDQLR
jgi:tetratricopeptide (TPR) repeat protein